jgi:hypothetical protein
MNEKFELGQIVATPGAPTNESAADSPGPPDGCDLDEGEIVGCELVVAGGYTTTLLDLVEEPFDQVSRSVEIRAEADSRKDGRPSKSRAG